jgi:hypothetical protein
MNAGPGGKPKRKLKNFLLQPLLQVKLGLYSIIMAVVFSIVFSSVLIISFQRLFDLILDLTDLRDEVVEIINAYLVDIGGWLVLIVLVYLTLNVFISILFTHRLVGPTIAFRRHIKALSEGRYNSRITLRKQDAFAEVAEDLNNLAAIMEKKAKS